MTIFSRTPPTGSSEHDVIGIPPIRGASSRPSRLVLIAILSLGTAAGLSIFMLRLRAGATPADPAPGPVPEPTLLAEAAPSPRIFVAPFLKAAGRTDAGPVTSTPASSVLPSALSSPLDLTTPGGRRDAPNTPTDLLAPPPKNDVLMVNTPDSAAPLTGDTVRARRHANTSLMLAAGSVIGCALETAIDSEKSGLVTCVVTDDVFGDDAKDILIEHGTHVLGEYRGESKLGDARIGVIWNRLRKSDGTTVDLVSPGTDQQGHSGIPGQVDNHWISRIGAAVLLSVIEDSVAAATTPKGQGTTVVLSNTASTGTSMSQRVLDATINAPPTISVNAGARINILVAKDIDFEGVYAIR